ncbi:MAG: alpha/beta fold hydrolase [Alphaproteobacteria bacterium]
MSYALAHAQISQSQLVPTNGIEMHMVEAGDGPPLTFIHGLGWDEQMWVPALERYSGSYRCIAGDSRGHGLSSQPAGPYTMAQFADDWAGALASVSALPGCVVGLSQGGMVAQALATRAPHLIDALVLVSTTCKADPQTAANMSERLESMHQTGARAGAEIAATSIFSEGFRAANPGYIEAFIDARAAQPQAPLISAMAALQDFDYSAGLEALDIPTLVISGSEDALTPPDAVREVADHIPGAELVEMPGAGHIIPAEQPEAFYAIIDRFLSRHYAATNRPIQEPINV